MFSRKVLLLCLVLLSIVLLSACSPSKLESSDQVEETKLNNSVERSDLKKVISSGAFTISPPKSQDYRALTYEDKDIFLYFSFEPELINNYELQYFDDYFNYVNIWVHFPDEETDSTEVYYNNFQPIREKVEFLSFNDGVLTGKLSLHIDEITTKTYDNNDKSCITGDLMGICYSDKYANIDYSLSFSLLVPE